MPAEQCPPEAPDQLPDFENLHQAIFPDLTSPILAYLNRGGSREHLMTYLAQQWKYEVSMTAQDLTGDAVPELLFRDAFNWYVFGCDHSTYRTLLEIDSIIRDMGTAPFVVAVRDMNLDGVPEVVTGQRGGGGSTTDRFFQIFEWNGTQFQALVKQPDFTSHYGQSGVLQGWIYTEGADHGSVVDIDHNGTWEFVVSEPRATGDGKTDNPRRTETFTYMWNGEGFVLYSSEIDPPQYRFQAVQDADFASLDGKYEKALALYQEVIFSDKLDWWSLERAQYYWYLVQSAREQAFGNTPSPLPTAPSPDGNEYPNLAAYARYRIMLLHVIQHRMPEAKIVYETLQAKFPDGTTGHAYAAMATAFWNAYLGSGDVGQSCAQAVEYATSHLTEIFRYLGYVQNINYEGSIPHGDQSYVYAPGDICPFK